MMPLQKWPLAGCLLVLAGGLAVCRVSYGDEATDRAIAALKSVDTEGAGFEDAIPAARQLRELPSKQIPQLLDSMEGTNPIAENWIRGVVFDLARRTDQLPLRKLGEYAMDRSRNPIGRGLAMELIRGRDADEAGKLIARCIDDPSLALREMAVEQAIGEARNLARSEDNEAAKRRYRDALAEARHPRQISRIIEALGELGDEVNRADAFSLITRWSSIGPFDNVGGVGYEAVYPPESQFLQSGTVKLSESYPGKTDAVAWQEVAASSEGVVDLAAAYNKEKGAICYVYAEFESSRSIPAEARLGCINANKLWINGREVMANKVYHSGSMIDQYVGDFELQTGTNRILLKVCQNEQTEPWAQDWEFQFRITDRFGKPLRNAQ